MKNMWMSPTWKKFLIHHLRVPMVCLRWKLKQNMRKNSKHFCSQLKEKLPPFNEILFIKGRSFKNDSSYATLLFPPETCRTFSPQNVIFLPSTIKICSIELCR
ncbi:UNVERIFIED_CONTAM: hypothetical protein RMT77_001445 [Armadillidium vulgare]